jgi:hypothetical protein
MKKLINWALRMQVISLNQLIIYLHLKILVCKTRSFNNDWIIKMSIKPCSDIDALHYATYVGGTNCLNTGRSIYDLFQKRIALTKQENSSQVLQKISILWLGACFFSYRTMPSDIQENTLFKLTFMAICSYCLFVNIQAQSIQNKCKWELQTIEQKLTILYKKS